MSTNRLCVLIAITVLAPSVDALRADEVRFFEKDGVTYRETRQVIRRTVPETRIEQQDRTVYRETLTPDVQEVQRNYQTPVTEYRWAPCWQKSWVPFSKPYLAYRAVPTTRWESRAETVRIPYTRRELVAEKRTEQIPITTQRVVEDEIISRVAVGRAGSSDPFARTAGLPPSQGQLSPAPFSRSPLSGAPLGGVSKLESDPPRQGAGWRPSDAIRR